MEPTKIAPTSGAKGSKNKYPTPQDFARVAAAALDNIDRVLSHWLPGGQIKGGEWHVRNPTRDDQNPGNFSVKLATGQFHDLANGDGGGDLIALVHYIEGTGHQSDALALLAEFLHIPPIENNPDAIGHTGAATPRKREPTPKAPEPRPIMPVPPDALASKPQAHPKHGKASQVWQYRDASGDLLFEVLRFDPPGKRKLYSPLSFWPDGWHWKGCPAPKPLYALDRLAERSEAVVYVEEGEKAADAGAWLIPSGVHTTTPNGAASPEKADFSPLAGRKVRICPDHDEPGAKYAKTVARLALDAGAVSVEILDLAALGINPVTGEVCPLPKGFDLADMSARGWNPETLAAFVRWIPFKDAESATATPEGETQADGDTAAKPEATPATPEGGAHADGDTAAKATQAHPHHKTAKPGAGAVAVAVAVAELPEGFELDPDGSTHKRAGLYFVQLKNRTDPETGEPAQSIERIWLCGPVRVAALCRNADGGEWGRVLEFEDRDGRAHRVVVDLTMLAGSGEGLRSLLLGHGLEISTLAEARRRLMDFILHSHPPAKARITHKTGWHGNTFVLPDRTIGPGDADPVIYSSEAETPAFVCKGSLQEWQDNIARYAVGNALLTFCISLGLVPPMLEFTQSEGWIIHFRGRSTATSSGGKTTMLRVNVSFSGAPETLRRWRLTDNSLEATCEGFNDLCLCLDELAQLDPRAAGDAAYLIAHGEGKGRMGRGGEARPVRRWRTVGLSSGEISLEQHMQVAERKHRAGQAVRFIELTADAGHDMGVFADLHGFPGPAQFADHLREAATQFHGTALDAWLKWIVANRAELASKVRDFKSKFVERALSGMAHPEPTVRRVCGKFALTAVAGELGIAAGILPWPTGEAVAASSHLFNAWLADRGSVGSQEEGRLVEQVKDFLARHGEARFSDWHRSKLGDDRMPRTVNRAGFVVRFREADGLARDTVEEEDGTRSSPTRSEFYVFREIFRNEICAGYDYRDAEKALVRAGILLPGKDRVTVKPRLPGFANPPRVYRLTLDEGAAGAS